ncbi:MAG TPA: ABC transporter ATP-binding protein [Acidimicrobiales bacterium]|jgi:ABC-2 type transport system ATP-binding protein|nr:ABC transporter ATP-binding protein [Acidimicrobiales bacterium]
MTRAERATRLAPRPSPAEGGPAIEAAGLRRTFPSGVALEGLTLQVDRGEVLALLGPNGAGKTTTVRLLNGVLRPDSGTCRVLGIDPTTDGHSLRKRTGVLTENAGLDDRLTARENLVFAARVHGYDRRAATARVDELLERFELTDRRDVPVQGASTGQRKRLALVRALVHDPEVLFLDEPTSGLDPSATRTVLDLIGELAAKHGRTVVLCTHFLGEAGRLADRMAVLHRGRLHAFGRPEDLAAELWPGLRVDLDLGRRGDEAIAQALRAQRGVLSAEPVACGLTTQVEDREVVPRLVAELVGRGLPVYGATPQPVTLEQVYFAIEARIAAQAAERAA